MELVPNLIKPARSIDKKHLGRKSFSLIRFYAQPARALRLNFPLAARTMGRPAHNTAPRSPPTAHGSPRWNRWCTSRPRNRAGSVWVAGTAGLARGGRIDFTVLEQGLGPRSMYLFVMSVFLSSVVRGVESHANLWLGNLHHGSQPTFTPEEQTPLSLPSPAILARARRA